MKKIIALIMACLISLPASAAYECNVKVKTVLIYTDGTVNIMHSGRNDYTNICNLNVDRQGVSPVTCAMWTGLLQIVKKKDGIVNIYYNGTGTCATLPVYGETPAPVYIGDVTP